VFTCDGDASAAVLRTDRPSGTVLETGKKYTLLGKISSGQIVEKVDLNLGDRIATKGVSRSGLVLQRIVLAENYEIKGLRHRHRTPGEGQAAVALLKPQPQSPLRTFYTADYVYAPELNNAYAGTSNRLTIFGGCTRRMSGSKANGVISTSTELKRSDP
jgi:hypothetical protein